ncbi:hypothetical protein Lesp02_38940 [Lentzea sp. NBRC 105346]|uniref:terpene synthase family protein n=1 Tax=Lentzea sp. NBRC 105346 TaxID=3032205 RepID=UPI0024A44519|nr:hypothetical protein Lesp02_38940 [Lentzea sp. NBRC 105346]
MRVEIPEFHMLFEARTNPHLDQLRDRTRQWVRDKGFLDTGVWTPESLEAADYGLFFALANPDADAEHLDLLVDWSNWGWFMDDYFVEAFGRSRNLVGAKAFVERVKALTPIDGSTPPEPAGPVEQALADLWSRTLPILPVAARERFPQLMDDMMSSQLWELHNDAQSRVPDPVDFVEMRRKTVGADFLAVMAALGAGVEVPDTREARTLLQIFGDIIGLHNDIVSFEKDVTGEGSINNAVLAVRDFFGGELSDAVRVVNDLITARLREFQTVAAEAPAAFVKVLESFMAGYFDWAGRSGRYRVDTTPTSKRITFRTPSGFGTAAVLVR